MSDLENTASKLETTMIKLDKTEDGRISLLDQVSYSFFIQILFCSRMHLYEFSYR